MSENSLSNYEGNGVNETGTMCEDLSPGRCLTVRHGGPGYYQPSAQIIFFCLSDALTSVTTLMIQLSLHAIQLFKLSLDN